MQSGAKPAKLTLSCPPHRRPEFFTDGVDLVGGDSELKEELLPLVVRVRQEEQGEGVRVARVLEHYRKVGRDLAPKTILPAVPLQSWNRTGVTDVGFSRNRSWSVPSPMVALSEVPLTRRVDYQVCDPTHCQRAQTTGAFVELVAGQLESLRSETVVDPIASNSAIRSRSMPATSSVTSSPSPPPVSSR